MGERLRRINWSATLEIDGPSKSRGPGGGARYEVGVEVLVSHGQREEELRISVDDRRRGRAEEKAVEATFGSVVDFISAGLRKPLPLRELELVRAQFEGLYTTDTTEQQS